ncbi:MAG: hypothetical protein ACXVA9_08760 [Bdellovibrionales bacterium]
MKFIFFGALFILVSMAHANDSTQSLPQGIFGIRVNNVFVTGTDYEFGAGGSKGTVGDTHATSIKDQALHTASQSLADSGLGSLIFKQLVNLLNSNPLGQAGLNLTNSALQSMDLGQMKTNVVPSTSVTAPTIMYGVTKFWTMMVNVPFIRMKTDVSWEYVPGSSTATLNTASALANSAGITAIPNSSQFVPMAQSALAAKGYKPLQSQEKSFVGDTRLNNLFSLGKVGNLSFGAMNTLSLPTGPSHDATDLLDAGSFHHTFVEQEFTVIYAFSRKFQTYGSAGIRYNFSEKTNFRVPVDDMDLDPDASQTENLTRQIGLGKWVEAGFKYRVLPRFGFSAGLLKRTKDADKFSGDRGYHYEILEKTYPYNAESATSYKLGLTYDPLSNYQMGSIPVMVDLSYEEVIAGTSTSAIKQMMLSFSTFF